MRTFPASDPLDPGPPQGQGELFLPLISNCPKRIEPQSFCGRSHLRSTMRGLRNQLSRPGQLLICVAGSARQPERRSLLLVLHGRTCQGNECLRSPICTLPAGSEAMHLVYAPQTRDTDGDGDSPHLGRRPERKLGLHLHGTSWRSAPPQSRESHLLRMRRRMRRRVRRGPGGVESSQPALLQTQL